MLPSGSKDGASSNKEDVEEECCRINNEQERNEVTAIMKANPYVGALLLKYLRQLGLRANPDDAFSVCAPGIIPMHWLVPSGGSDRRSYTVPVGESPDAILARGIAVIRHKMT